VSLYIEHVETGKRLGIFRYLKIFAERYILFFFFINTEPLTRK